MSRVGCPNGCGICDVCGSNVCAGNCWESTALSEGALDPKVLLAEEEEKSDVDMNVFSALTKFVSLLRKNLHQEADNLIAWGQRTTRGIVDEAVLITLMEMAAANQRLVDLESRV